MASVTPPFRSYDALAEAALRAPHWPEDYRPQVRSLAAIFSKLDREVELEWLVDRPEVQQTLAQLLGCSVADLAIEVGRREIRTRDEGRRVRLDDVRAARAIDLLEEELCPGLPERVLQPQAWRRLWWIAPSGSGRTLLGRWLTARGVATVLSSERLSALAGQLPEHGPVLIEVRAGQLEPVPELRAGVCVAAPFPPYAASGWELVRSPEPSDYLEALVDWLILRLPSDAGSRFDRARLLAWLRSLELSSGRGHTLATVLGLCGLADEWGVGELEGKRLPELARFYYRALLARAAQNGNEDASWLRRLGFSVLVALGRSVLTDAREHWSAPRAFEEWLELVPEEHRRGADLEWMKLSLAHGKAALRTSDVEKAARRVPPGAFRIVRTLRAVGLLQPEPASPSEELLRVAPYWFSQVLELESRTSLAGQSPVEWGEALLSPGAAERMTESVCERFLAGDLRGLSEVLDLATDESPALVAALETAFTAAGLYVLQGGELPSDELEALWDEALGLSVALPGAGVQRRIEPAACEHALLARGTWLLAAWALSEQLPPSRAQRHPVLRPWPSRAPDPRLVEAYDAAASACLRPELARFAEAAFALVDRLRSTIGSVSDAAGTPHELERAGIFLDEVAHGVPSLETWATVCASDVARRALLALRRARKLSWQELAGAVLGATFRDAQEPPAAYVLDVTYATVELWRHAPVELLEAGLQAATAEQRALVYPVLSSEQWLALSAALESGFLRDDAAAWRAIPLQLARRLGETDALSGAALRALWQRDAPSMLRVLLELSADDPDALAMALDCAPRAETAAVVRVLEQRFDPDRTPRRILDVLRRWLHGRVAERAAEWQSAYTFFAAIERALRAVRDSG